MNSNAKYFDVADRIFIVKEKCANIMRQMDRMANL